MERVVPVEHEYPDYVVEGEVATKEDFKKAVGEEMKLRSAYMYLFMFLVGIVLGATSTSFLNLCMGILAYLVGFYFEEIKNFISYMFRKYVKRK